MGFWEHGNLGAWYFGSMLLWENRTLGACIFWSKATSGAWEFCLVISDQNFCRHSISDFDHGSEGAKVAQENCTIPEVVN